jgi:hypothetical protein
MMSGCNEIAEVVASSGVNFYNSKPHSAPGLSLKREWKITPFPLAARTGLYLPFLYDFSIPFLIGPLPHIGSGSF